MIPKETLDLKLVLKHAIKACRLGREVLLKYFGNLEKIEAKFQAGLVSEADRESEKVIAEYLSRHLPKTEFLGEESAYASQSKLTPTQNSHGRWILDPLDGTTNYIHRFPVFCISLGFEVDGDIQVGVIDVPILQETYTAIRGNGSYLNGRPIKVSDTPELGQALMATGFFAEKEDLLKEQLEIFSDLVKSCRGIRRPGAAAYDLCMVARGTFDGFWEKGLSPWDVSAGKLLVEEAGGLVTNFSGQKYSVYESDIVAGNPKIIKALNKKILDHVGILTSKK